MLTYQAQWWCSIVNIFSSVDVLKHPPVRMHASLAKLKLSLNALFHGRLESRLEIFTLGCEHDAMCREFNVAEANRDVCVELGIETPMSALDSVIHE